MERLFERFEKPPMDRSNTREVREGIATVLQRSNTTPIKTAPSSSTMPNKTAPSDRRRAQIDCMSDRMSGRVSDRVSNRTSDHMRDRTSAGSGGRLSIHERRDLERVNKSRQVKKVFVDAEVMKAKVRAIALQPPYDVSDYYNNTGIWQLIARHAIFERVTLSIIAINAVWMAVDTELNQAEIMLLAHPVFQLVEHLFCLFFTMEWTIRYMAFKVKRNGFRDKWFVFDSILVFTMVMETWVGNIACLIMGLPGGGGGLVDTSLLRLFRLLRLSRMARMVRLLRAMPELLILIKAMMSSLRSCFFVFILLGFLSYVFGIVFKQLTSGTPVGEAHFSSIWTSMHTLWLNGTLLDNTSIVISALAEETIAYVFIFYIFILLSALTLLNMLVGVLCEVVSAVSATEKETLRVQWVKAKILELIDGRDFDTDSDGSISKEELSKLLEFPEACKALSEIGVNIECLIDNLDFIFAAETVDGKEEVEKTFTFEEFMEMMLDLRGSNIATVKDIVELRKFIKQSNVTLRAELAELEGVAGAPQHRSMVQKSIRTSLGAKALPPLAPAPRDVLQQEHKKQDAIESWIKLEITNLKNELQRHQESTVMAELVAIKKIIRDSFETCVREFRHSNWHGLDLEHDPLGSPLPNFVDDNPSQPSTFEDMLKQFESDGTGLESPKATSRLVAPQHHSARSKSKKNSIEAPAVSEKHGLQVLGVESVNASDLR